MTVAVIYILYVLMLRLYDSVPNCSKP